MRLVKGIAWLGLALSILWLFKAPGFEPALACTGALITLGGFAYKDREKRFKKSNVQNQTVDGASTGIQAGGNISINSRSK